jgi:ATP-binding cassette subfamily B protein
VADRWAAKFSDQLDSSIRRRRLDNTIDGALGLLGVAAPLFVLVLGAHLALRQDLSIGTMMGLVALAGAALTPHEHAGADAPDGTREHAGGIDLPARDQRA